MEKGFGIGLCIVIVTVVVFVALGVEIALMPTTSFAPPIGPPAPTSLPIQTGTRFGLLNLSGGAYWSSVPIVLNLGYGAHLYRVTGSWTSVSRSGVLVNLDNEPGVTYPGTPLCFVGQPCRSPPDPFTYNGSLDVYLYSNNGSMPGWATPTYQPYWSSSSPPVPQNNPVTYYVVFAAPMPDIITVTGTFVVTELPAPIVGP
jgi:hypothetical protein